MDEDKYLLLVTIEEELGADFVRSVDIMGPMNEHVSGMLFDALQLMQGQPMNDDHGIKRVRRYKVVDDTK